ncbi:cardiolipin synthase [Paenibacillus sp. N3/727]|uniref:cardiolipin synthase n=1 Tax=Paenibacillus sp. N3/727 TaxID=2925845 RepID=UPI001F5389D8|nr:cardiolipin synthase [Paenibacillus sp. N3/727]UNK20974.1 cardiolipin synthase [Paenibacillus sp. N3/727]
MNITTWLLGLIIFLNIVFAFVVIFQERRDVGATWAWLLVLLLIPIAGFMLYLFFAQNFRRKKLFYWDDIKKRGLDRGLKSQVSQFRSQQFQFRNYSSALYKDLITMNLLNNQAVLSEDNQVKIYTDGKEKFAALFRDIEEATDFIHVQYYIIQKDNLGRQLMELLTQKAKEGVKVRVLYDELGSRRINKKFLKDLRDAGGQAEAFFPSKFRLINIRLNYRNHRKLVIIDGKIGYVGGFNVGDEYLGLDPKFGYWRDTHLRIEGTAVYSIQTRFILDWNQASHIHDITYFPSLFPHIPAKGDVGIQIVTSGPESEYEHIKNGYLKMITSARKSIYIQTPYFIPDASVLDALKVASLSGVEVNIMIPDKPDHMFVYWATLSYIGELLKAGANVYLYSNGFIHAKTLVVDEEIASVGTANVDFRSFKLNFEVNAFVYDEGIAQQLSHEFRQDISVSTLLTMEKYLERSRWIRIKESISRLLSPIL